MSTPAEIVMGRKSPILSARERQLRFNHLADEGGRPYIDARLWRAPNESDLSWNGSLAIPHDPNKKGEDRAFGMVGRKDRTTYVNDAGRVVSKIQQYLFKSPVSRGDAQNAPELAEIGGEGVDADKFWRSVSSELTVGQWCWIAASREATPGTLAGRGADTDAAVRWTLYPAASVPDWYIDERGVLQWAIVEAHHLDASDPFAPAVNRVSRTLWRLVPGGVQMMRFEAKGESTAELVADVTLPLDSLPIVLVGKPSVKPWWFDDVEQMQCQMLNLDSLHVENLVRTVFPQLVISEGTYNSLQTTLVERLGAQDGEEAMRVVKEIVRGADAPLVETAEESGTSRYLTPSATDLAQMPNEIERKRKLLFEVTGLTLFNRESRQMQTAESKRFDHMDTESTLLNRSAEMQRAEAAVVALSRKLDPDFPDYQPVWPTSFDVPDTAADAALIEILCNLPDLVPSMRKLNLKAALRIVSDMSGNDPELVEAANKEIDEADFSRDALANEIFGGGGGGGE